MVGRQPLAHERRKVEDDLLCRVERVVQGAVRVLLAREVVWRALGESLIPILACQKVLRGAEHVEPEEARRAATRGELRDAALGGGHHVVDVRGLPRVGEEGGRRAKEDTVGVEPLRLGVHRAALDEREPHRHHQPADAHREAGPLAQVGHLELVRTVAAEEVEERAQKVHAEAALAARLGSRSACERTGSGASSSAAARSRSRSQ
eukprot:3273704-Prymnesium_polylepis.1